VQECVNSARRAPTVFSNQAWHRLLKEPSPET
jgi:hypothetical protein